MGYEKNLRPRRSHALIGTFAFAAATLTAAATSAVKEPPLSCALADFACLEKTRLTLNAKRADPANPNPGDRYVFERGLALLEEASLGNAEALAVTPQWANPPASPPVAHQAFWGDSRYVYRYFASLAAQTLIDLEAVPASWQSHMIPPAPPAPIESFLEQVTRDNGGTLPDFFRPDAALKLLPKELLGPHSRRTLVSLDGQTVGFVLDGSGLGTRFLYDGLHGLNLDPVTLGTSAIADFPVPMQSEGPRLIELGASDGVFVDQTTSGGWRRRGVAIVTRDGRAIPFPVDRIEPALWGSRQSAPLNISRSRRDLRALMTLIARERLGLFMEMLTLRTDPRPELSPVRVNGLPGGRRLLVWKDRAGPPALLVVGEGFEANHATWLAYRLGYTWGINCDVNYLDGAAYWVAGKRTVFGRAFKAGERPFHRVVLFEP